MNSRWIHLRLKRLLLCAVCAASLSVALAWAPRQAKAQQPPQQSIGQAALQVALELASDFGDGPEPMRQKVLALIDQQGNLSDAELAYSYAAFITPGDSQYSSLAAAQATDPLDYLVAMHISFGRYKSAQSAGDQAWSAKQLKATQEYAALAAKALVAEAQLDERDAAALQKLPFAVRRPSAQQAAYLENLKKNGLNPAHLKLLRDSGRTEQEITSFQETLLASPPDQVGFSAVEFMSQIAASRRQLAADLDAFAQASPAALAGSAVQTFLVANPHDQPETVDLFIRPVSIPNSWRLAIMNVASKTASQTPLPTLAASAPRVREVEPGKHYAVNLPAKGQIEVASLVIPSSEVGVNTTARWAVEGKIGDELIGGMMHEMNVPSIIPDLQLPPVGSAPQQTANLAPPSSTLDNLPLYVGAAALILFVLALFAFLVLRARRRA